MLKSKNAAGKKPAQKTTSQKTVKTTQVKTASPKNAQGVNFVANIAGALKTRIETTIKDCPSIEKDLTPAVKSLKNEKQVLNGIEIFSKLANTTPDVFVGQLVSDLSLIDKRNPRFIAQKVIGKLIPIIEQVGSSLIARDSFAYSFLSGLYHEAQFSTELSYSYLSVSTVSDPDMRKKIFSQGGSNWGRSTATTQTSQMRQLSRILGLAPCIKGKRKEVFSFNPEAKTLLENLLGIKPVKS